MATWECAKNSVEECEDLVAAMHASLAGKRKNQQIAARNTREFLRKAAVFENAARNPDMMEDERFVRILKKLRGFPEEGPIVKAPRIGPKGGPIVAAAPGAASSSTDVTFVIPPGADFRRGPPAAKAPGPARQQEPGKGGARRRARTPEDWWQQQRWDGRRWEQGWQGWRGRGGWGAK